MNEVQKITAQGLSIERLKTFCQIVEAGSIAQAAKRNPIQQSQFSRQLSELETALGVRLFIRTGRNWTLTDHGRRLALLTRSYFHELDALSGPSLDQPEIIKIAAGESVLNGMVFPRFGEIRETFKGAVFQFECLSTAALLESLELGTNDLVVIRDDVLTADHGRELFCTLEFKLVVPRNLLPEKMASGLDALKSLPVGMLTGNGTYTAAIKQLAIEANVQLKVAVYVSAFPQMCEIMKTGNLAGIVPAWHAAEFPVDRFAVVEINELKALSRKLMLAYHHKAAALRPSLRSIPSKLKSALL